MEQVAIFNGERREQGVVALEDYQYNLEELELYSFFTYVLFTQAEGLHKHLEFLKNNPFNANTYNPVLPFGCIETKRGDEYDFGAVLTLFNDLSDGVL